LELTDSLLFCASKKMKILITGSTGFVGSNFVKRIKDIDIIEVDLLVHKIQEVDFLGVDSVLHLAALVHQMKDKPEEQYYKVNRDLSFETAKMAKAQGVKQFVFMSTIKVYGESTTHLLPLNEFSLCNPKGPYGKSKHEAEKLIKGLEDENFRVAIVRSPLVYGSGVKANMFNLIKLVNIFSVLPFGGIKNKRSIVFVGNLVSLLQHIINKRASGVFIAGDSMPLSTTLLTKLIAESFNKKILLIKIPCSFLKIIGMMSPAFVDRLWGSMEVDNHFTNEKLQFSPPFSSAEGILEMVSWYKESF
jgi:UDP-glucose 4-epimerase